MEKNDLKKWIILIVVGVVSYWTINNFSIIGNFFSTIVSILSPFILGGCLAFILNIPMSFLERKLTNTKNKKSKQLKKSKIVKIISLILSVVIIVLIFVLIINLIVPELINVVNLLINNVPYYLEELIKFVETYGQDIDISAVIQESNIDVHLIKDEILSKVPQLLTSSVSLVTGIINGITTFVIAFIFAIYLLMDKENLKEQATKLLIAYTKKGKADKIINLGRVTKNTFKSFFTVQCLEATILGMLCMIGMLILKIPYAVPIGVLVGVTALIPVVGAFIGCIIGAILIVAVEPLKVITFIVFFLILQQVEGNLIYPRVVGNSIGLPGMWVLVAVTVGGEIGGVLGMLIGVPVATVLYTLLKKDVNKKINQKREKEILE